MNYHHRNYDDLDIEQTNDDDWNKNEEKYSQLQVYQTQEEKHLLKNSIVHLDDGTRAYVFSREDDTNNVPCYLCHVCQAYSIHSWGTLAAHISGKKHTVNMEKAYHPATNFTRIVEDSLEVQPGQPAPPGMEDMVEPRKCIIQTKLDSYKTGPLIGIEYLVEIINDNYNDPNYCPSYYCMLCNKQGVFNNILVHLTSQQHYLKYLQKYFATTYTALSLVPKTSEYKKGTSVITAKIVSRIETKYGRLKPRQYHSDSFLRKKNELLEQIEGEFHFRETIEDDYITMVDWTMIKNLQYCLDDVTAENEASKPKNADVNTTDKDKKSLFNKTARINVDKRQLRKDRSSLDENGNPNKDGQESPDVIIVEDDKAGTTPVKRSGGKSSSLSSISTASSSSKRKQSYSRTFSRSRSSSPRNRYNKSLYRSRFRRHSRSRSPANRRGRFYNSVRYRNSRSRSRSPSRYKRYRSRSRSQTRYGRRSRSPQLPYPRRRRSRSRSHSRSRSPKFNPYGKGNCVPRYLRSLENPKGENRIHLKWDAPAQFKYKWEKFREEFKVIQRVLEDKLKYHEKNPEKHPVYPDEWRIFWNRRYKELQAEGTDPAKHDFKPEWIKFWNDRMIELHNDEVSKEKDKLKEKLGLQEDSRNDDQPSSSQTENMVKNDVTLDDIKNTWKALTGSEIKESSTKSVSSVAEDLNLDEHVEIRHQETYRSRLPPPGARKGFIPFDDDSPRVISVLRLITVLESQLGSLGPKIVALLSKAIAMEKFCTNSSQEILCNEEHCVLFETVKEKLKGLLFAGLVERTLVNATRVALRSIEDLFLKAPKIIKKEKPPPANLVPVPVVPVTVPGIGTIDRVAIAQQIAAALVAQGKTDVTEEELEQLINAVVGMAQASNSSTVPITTAVYSNQLTQRPPSLSAGGNAVSSGLKLLQSAYDEEDVKSDAIKNEVTVGPSTHTAAKSFGITDLSDKDIKRLLENFSSLAPNEQNKFKNYLKKLTDTDPRRIASLQQVVNISAITGVGVNVGCSRETGNRPDRLSPFSVRSGALNPSADEMFNRNIDKFNGDKNEDEEDDDDDCDYSVEDVYKAASENVRQQERKKLESVLADIAEVVKKSTLQNDVQPVEVPVGAVQLEPSTQSALEQHSSSYSTAFYQQPQYQQQASTTDIGFHTSGSIYPGNSQLSREFLDHGLANIIQFSQNINNKPSFPSGSVDNITPFTRINVDKAEFLASDTCYPFPAQHGLQHQQQDQFRPRNYTRY